MLIESALPGECDDAETFATSKSERLSKPDQLRGDGKRTSGPVASQRRPQDNRTAKGRKANICMGYLSLAQHCCLLYDADCVFGRGFGAQFSTISAPLAC